MLHDTGRCIAWVSHLAEIFLEIVMIQNRFSTYRAIIVHFHVLNYRRYFTDVVCNDVAFKSSSTSNSFYKFTMLVLEFNSSSINLFFYEIFTRMLCEPFFQFTFITKFKKCASNKEMFSFLEAVNVVVFSTYCVKKFRIWFLCS